VILRCSVVVFCGLAAWAQPRLPDVGYVPTAREAVDAMLRLAQVKKGDVVYDLGCGDGRIVIAAAARFGARGVGIEIDPELVARARENARRARVEHLVRFEQGDIFKADIREATVVTLYLLTMLNQKLRPKLLRELRPGTRIVSNTFDMGREWKPDKVSKAGSSKASDIYFKPPLYLWIVPPAKER
jgi:SAM-dependent methyltransferase